MALDLGRERRLPFVEAAITTDLLVVRRGLVTAGVTSAADTFRFRIRLLLRLDGILLPELNTVE